MATPVDQEYDYEVPVKTEDYEYHVPVSEVSKPGFIKRFAQSFGLPTNSQEIVDSVKSTALGVAVPVVGPALKSTADYLQNAGKAIKEGFGEAAEAGRNVAEGGPILPNAGKAFYGGLHAGLGAVPVVGPTIETAGTDIGTGNIAGGAGGIAGLATQVALMNPKVAGKMSKIGEKPTPIDPDIAYEHMGLAAQKYVAKPVEALRAEVAKHAEPLAKAVDSQFPQGSISKASTLDVLGQAIDKYFPTNTRAGFEFPAGLRAVVEELKSQTPNTMTWEQAKSLRSALGGALDKVKDRASRAPLSLAYKNLSEQMRTSAKAVGMEDSFNQYNEVHKAERALGELALDDVVDAQSGTDALKALVKQKGALKIRLQDLRSYGIDPNEITSLMDAYKPGENAKLQRSIIDHWAARHAAGALGSLMGVGFLPGYGGMLALQIAREGGRAALPHEAVSTGEGISSQNRIPQPLEPSTPTITPTVVKAETSFADRMKALPPIKINPQTETPAQAAPISPELPKSRYAETHQRLAEAGRLRKSLATMRSGKRSLTDAEWQFIEKRTGLDMADPANIPKALTKLRELLKAETEGKQ